MAYINITIDTGAATVAQSNARVPHDSTCPREGMNDLVDLMAAIAGGLVDVDVDVVVTNVDPAVAAAGGGVTRAYVLK